MIKFKIIACINNKGALGKDNKLLYHIKSDMANFKRMTIDNVVIMGKKTFESLPGKKPLPNRVNIVLSSDSNFHPEGVIVADTIAAAIKICEEKFSHKMCFVIGGASLYVQFIAQELVDEMFLTIVDDDSNGDTYFPEILEDKWKVFFESETSFTQGEKKLGYKFIIYKKK